MTNYFEGWYFKIVDKTENHIYAVIPGVSYGEHGEAQAFIQFFDGKIGKMEFFPFDIEEFEFKTEEFEIKIGKNIFTSSYFSLDLNGKEFSVIGKIEFTEFSKWPVSIFQPGVMGWYRYVPKMECYHGIVSMDHRLIGNLAVNNTKISFDNGKGYIEKDYGRSFPLNKNPARNPSK